MVKVDDEGATRKDAARSNHGIPSVELVFCHSGPPLPQNVVSSFVQHSAVATMRRELLLRDALPDPGRGTKEAANAAPISGPYIPPLHTIPPMPLGRAL